MTDSIPWTAAVSFNGDYNTLTLSIPNPRPKKCGCGVLIPAERAVALTSEEAYARRKAGKMCLRCAVKTIKRCFFNFYQLSSKDYPHFRERTDGPLTQDATARAFAAAYLSKYPDMATPAWIAFALEGAPCP